MAFSRNPTYSVILRGSQLSLLGFSGGLTCRALKGPAATRLWRLFCNKSADPVDSNNG